MSNRVNDRTFTGVDVEIDGNFFERCTFKDCALVFRGTAYFGLENCALDDSALALEGAAQTTFFMLQDMYRNGYTREIDAMVDAIRNPPERYDT